MSKIITSPKIDEQPSGEITEYIECSSIKTISAVANAIAPPDPPSPIIIDIIGEPIFNEVCIDEAIDSD